MVVSDLLRRSGIGTLNVSGCMTNRCRWNQPVLTDLDGLNDSNVYRSKSAVLDFVTQGRDVLIMERYPSSVDGVADLRPGLVRKPT